MRATDRQKRQCNEPPCKPTKEKERNASMNTNKVKSSQVT